MTSFKDKSRNHWRYHFTYQGRRHYGGGFPTKRKALEAETEHRKLLKQQEKLSRQTSTDTDFLTVANEYLDSVKRRFVKKTFDYKKMVFKGFIQFLGSNPPIGAITFKDIEAYLNTRPSNNNWNAHRKELHTLFKYALKCRYVNDNPVEKVDRMPHTPARKNVPTAEQIDRLLAIADPDHELPLLLTILHTLARIDEIYRLKWKDVDFDRKQLVLWTRKRKGGSYEADPMPLNDVLYNCLKGLNERRTQNEWVFLNPKTGTRYNRRIRFMKGLCKRAFDPGCKNVKEYNGPVFGFHSLRHFMATYLSAKTNGSIKDMQRLLRHKDARTTEIYLHKLGDGLRDILSVAEVFNGSKKV